MKYTHAYADGTITHLRKIVLEGLDFVTLEQMRKFSVPAEIMRERVKNKYKLTNQFITLICKLLVVICSICVLDYTCGFVIVIFSPLPFLHF